MNKSKLSPVGAFFSPLAVIVTALLLAWAPGARAQIVISSAPQSATNTVGDNVEFFVGAANGSDTLTYQWTNSSGPIANATNKTLVLLNVQLTNADTYTVIITDATASLTNSASATLTVNSTFGAGNNLAAWLPFNDGVSNPSAQTAADASGNNNSGTLENFENDGGEWVSGVTGPSGGALFYANLNGLSNNIVVINDAPNLNFTNNLAFTLSAWVAGAAYSTFEGSYNDSPWSSGQIAGADIISKGNGNGGEQYELDCYTSGDFRFYVRNASGATTGVSTTTPVSNSGVWQHVVATFDGNAGVGKMFVYVNGNLVGSNITAPSSLLYSTAPVTVGNRASSGTSGYNQPFIGVIDDVRIYDYALSASDVAALYGSYSTSVTPNVYATPTATQPIFAGGNLPLYGFEDGLSSLSYSWTYTGTNATTSKTSASLTISNLAAGSNGTATLTVTNLAGSGSKSITVNGVTPYTYAAAVMALNPLVYWPLDETNNKASSSASAVAYDYVKGNNAIVNDVATIGVTGPGTPQYQGFPAGHKGLGIVQQTNGFALPTAFGLSTANPTFTAWIYTTQNSQASSAGLIFCRQSGQAGGMEYNGQLGYTWNNNSSATYNFASHLVPTNGVWTFVAIAVGPSSTIAYMGGTNGVLYSATNVNTASTVYSWTTDGNMFLGEDPNSATIGAVNTSRIFNGSIADAAVFNYQLSAAQIQSLYFAGGFVPQLPYMLASTNVNQGQSVTFTVTNIAGSLPMSYTWYSTSTNGSTNLLASGTLTNYTGNTASVTVNNVRPSQNGNVYYLSVSNQYGTTTSNTLLNVFAAPTITAGPSPANANIFFGESISFNVTANGASPLTYQWSTNGAAIAGATNSSVTLTTPPVGTWNVVCSVSNLVGSTSSNATLTVVAVPSAGFPQAVLALQPTGYWRLNEADDGLMDNNDGQICHDYIAANNGIYTNTALGQSGYNSSDSAFVNYDSETSAWFGTDSNANSCAYNIPNVDFSAGTGTNVTFTVQAWAKSVNSSGNTPAVVGKGIYNNEEFTIDAGNDVAGQNYYRFEVRSAALTSYSANSTVLANDSQWHFLVGVCDEVNGKITLYIDGTNAASAAIPAKSGLAQTYASFPMSIGARSSAGTSYNQQFVGYINDLALFNYALTSNQVAGEYVAAGVVPTVYLVTNNITVNEYDTATNTAIVLGTPPLALQWYYMDVSNNTSVISGQTNAALAFSNIQSYYASVFVVVSNTYGAVTSAPAQLTINSGPAYIETDITPLNLNVPRGTPVTYSVVAYGALPISYQWFLDGSPIAGATNPTYSFTALLRTNTYQCGVSNSQNGSYSLGQIATVVALNPPPSAGFNTNGTGWQLQGLNYTPTIANNILALTTASANEAASAYYTTAQYIANGFVASFTYTPSGGTSTRGDGTAFVLQNSSSGPGALGTTGGGLGIVGTSPSVEFELDLYTGSAGGTGINWETNGATASSGGVPNGGTGSVNINSGDPINVTINYTSASNNVQVTLVDATTHASYTTNYALNGLTSLLGSDVAYIGFAGATGADDAVQSISNFSFSYIAPQEAPIIVQDVSPLFQAFYAGDMVTYSIVADGTAPLSYAWFENGTNIPGATNATYTFPIPVGTNTFQCGVTNSLSGGVYTNSSVATLVGAPLPSDAFAANLLSYGPVAYWRLDESAGSTTAYDYAGGFNGYYGSVTTNGQPGIPNPPFLGLPTNELGVWMDSASASTNGFVATAPINMSLSNATLLCWVYPNGSQTNSEGLVFSRGATANGINYGALNYMAYTWNNNSATYDWTSGLTIPTNTWSFLALVITPSNAVAYVFNTTRQASATNAVANPTVTITNGFALGADPQSSTLTNRIFNGEMDDVAVFNYALTSAQLSQIYTLAPTGLTVTIQHSAGSVILTWPFGSLYESTNVNGSWMPVPGATSPYTNTPSASQEFYRVIAAP